MDLGQTQSLALLGDAPAGLLGISPRLTVNTQDVSLFSDLDLWEGWHCARFSRQLGREGLRRVKKNKNKKHKHPVKQVSRLFIIP